MNRLEKLRAKLAQLQGRMTTMLNENPDGLDDALSAEYDQLEADFDATRADIEQEEKRVEKQREREVFMAQPQRAALVETSVALQGEVVDDDKESYRASFWAAQTRQPLTDAQTRALSTGTGDKGGYLVPEEFQTTIVEKLAEKSYIRNLATVSMSSSTTNIPVEGVDGANGWIDENGAYPESDPTLSQIVMKAYKTGRIIKVSEELLADSFTSIEAYIAGKFVKSTIKAEEEAFVVGDGVGKPTGFLLDATLGKTAAANNAITADEIIDLWGSLDEDYAGEAHWMMNRNTLVALMKLKDGNGDYLVNKGLNGAPSTLLGRPIVINKNMPDIGSETKPIAFGDFSYYFIKDRKVMEMKRLDEKYADYGQVGFRIDKRVDGKLVVDEAINYLQMAS